MHLWENIKTKISDKRNFDTAKQAGYNALDLGQYRNYNRYRPQGAKRLFCYLPYNSLTFSFGGQVFVCSYNRDVLLGKYPHNTIDEIWNGAEAKRLREYMSHNDLDYGCRHCKYFFDKGKFTNLRPLVFDKYYQNTAAVFPKVFEFELSNECNLECQMCHGEVSSSIRKNRDKLPPLPMHYDDHFVQQLEKYIPHLKEAKFYGGEPFLISIYYKIWDKIKALNPELDLFVITNGTHWNKKIERLMNDLNFDVAVSIDAYDKEKVERIRKNVVYEKLIDNIYQFSEVCNRKEKHLSLSFTVQKDNWEQLPLIIDLCNKVNACIYVSYLERPLQFALTSLPKEEMKSVREYMNRFSFPTLTQKERHNAKCFEDFKHYLDTYIENEIVKKYLDYEFNQHLLLSEDIERKQKPQALEPISFNALLDWIDKNYETNWAFAKKLPKEILIRELTSVLSIYSEEERDLLHALIKKESFESFLMSVKTSSVEELKKMSRMSLDELRKHITVTV